MKYYFGVIDTSLGYSRVELLKKMTNKFDNVKLIHIEHSVVEDEDMVYGSHCYVCVRSNNNSDKVHQLLNKLGLKLEERALA